MNTIPRVWSFILLFGLLALAPQITPGSGNGCDDDCNISCNSNDCNGSSCNSECDEDCVSSRTTFVPRLQTTDPVLELGLFNYHFYHHVPCPEDRAFFHWDVSYFHKESKNECELAGFFTPNGNRCFTVRQDGEGDVGSLWLNLSGDNGQSFGSEVCLCPKRKVDGGYFNFYFDFNSWLCGAWASISFAAMRAKHTLGLSERALSNPPANTTNQGDTSDGGFANAIAALNNEDWNAGRLFSGEKKETGVDDVQIKIGWNYYFCNLDHVGIYFVATGPTGDKCQWNQSKCLFEPFVGSRHGSVGFGLNGDYTLWDCCDQALTWMADFKYRYVLSRCENRLFDLKDRSTNSTKINGPWSRYLLVAESSAPGTSAPGVNSFRVPVDVRPGSTIDFWTALHYNWCDYHFEFGYNLFWKDCEELCINRSGSLGVGIFDLNGLGNPVSASQANISQTTTGSAGPSNNVAPSDATFTEVQFSDLDANSARHPRSLSHTIYGGTSWNTEVWCMPLMVGFIGSYEFADCNTAFDQWGVQLRGSVSF